MITPTPSTSTPSTAAPVSHPPPAVEADRAAAEAPGHVEGDPLERALALALEAAARAGDLERIDRIVAELRARRLADAGNVVDVDAATVRGR